MPKNRILVADDNKLNQDLLSAILGNDYDYLYANNGIEVISALEKNEAIDIILLDINMPQMDGFEVLQALNEKQYIKEIPVVVISTENDVAFVRRAYELGATDYISRPFNAIVIQHRVKNTLMIYSNQKKLVKLVENQIYEREKTNNAMINIFSNIIELRNHESGSHTLHVQTITNLLLHELVKITDKYPLSEADISLISSLSALHDIGKIKIPESILNKPCQLTDEEWKIMKMHTIEGYEILQHANIDQNNNFMKTAKGSYAQVIGKFIDIHNDVLNVGLEKINNSNDVRSLILNLKTTFPFVRIVDAKKCYVLSISKKGRIIDTKKHCYEIWGKNSPCEYCSSKNALKKKQWVSKLEVKEGKIFAVLSRYLSLNNKDYVLEIAFPVDEEETKPENRTRLMSSLLFINFYRDSLTKAYTRTYLEDFKDNLEKADAIALLDVDDFKNINDTYGHQVGDIALKEISSVIMNTIGSNNVLIRYGGDEFLAIFQEIEEEDFYNKFIKIKNAVNAISLKDYPDIKLNISIGGAYKSCSLDNAITKADREMYKEKTKI